jgi:hypothetical protein
MFLLALAVLGVLPAAAFGQSASANGEGPLVIRQRGRLPLMTLDPFRGSVRLTGLYQREKEGGEGDSTNATNILLTQELSLGTGGHIVSPNLFSWTGGGTVALQEEWSRTGGEDSSQQGMFTAYDLQGDILSATDFPMHVYALRGETFVNRAFASLLRNTTSAEGASIKYNSPVIPTSLNYRHAKTTQADLDGDEQYSVEDNAVEFATQFQPFERQNVSINYNFAQIMQDSSTGGGGDYELHDVSASHQWALDADARFTLSQSLNYSLQSGQTAYERLRLSERLDMRLAENLDGQVIYDFDRQDQFASSLSTHRLTGSLTHRLYDSLTTTLRGGGGFDENSFSAQGGSSTSRNMFATIGTSYLKKVYLGRLGADVALGYHQTDSEAISQPQHILGEAASFSNDRPVILTRSGVDARSIVVTDAAGVRHFVEGLDYTVREVGNAIHVERVIGGNIALEDSVRLDYVVDPQSEYTSQTTTLGAGSNYTFDEGFLRGLNLYGRYFQSDQSISPTTSSVRADSIRDTTVGADYTIWKLTFGAERQNHDSTLAPHNATRLTARYADRLGDRTTLMVQATQQFLEFPDAGSETALTSVTGNLGYEITRDLRSSISARWRYEDSTLGQLMGIEEQAELRWRLRQTDAFFLIRHTMLESRRGSERDSFFFQFGISRNF